MSLSLSNKPPYSWCSYHDSWTFVSFHIFSFVLFIRRLWVSNFERTVFLIWPIVFLSVVIAGILSTFSFSAVKWLIFSTTFSHIQNPKANIFFILSHTMLCFRFIGKLKTGLKWLSNPFILVTLWMNQF